MTGDDVGEVKYAGWLPMSPEDIRLLGEDIHAFEKILRAMAGAKPYHYVLFMQSYGSLWGERGGATGKTFSPAPGAVNAEEASDELVWKA